MQCLSFNFDTVHIKSYFHFKKDFHYDAMLANAFVKLIELSAK